MDTISTGSSVFQWIIAIWVNMPLVFYGMLAGWISPMGVLLQSQNSPSGYPLSDSVISWMASSNALTAILFAPIFSWAADRYGRKAAVVALTIPQGVSWCLKFDPSNEAMLLIARFIFGISAGGCFVIAPTFVREISEDRLRGTLGSLLMINQNIGILIIYIMGGLLDYYTLLWIVCCLPFAHSIISLWLPETPCFSVKKGDIEEAKRTLAWLRRLDIDDKLLLHEIEMLKLEEEERQKSRKVTFSSIWNEPAKRRALIVSLALIFVQAAGGAFAVITYAGTILADSDLDATLQSIAIAVVLIAGAIVSMTAVERFGRKCLLILSCVLISISMCCLGVTLSLRQQSYATPSWIPIASLTMILFAYGFGTSPLPYVIMSELFSFQHRASLIGVVTTYAWMLTFVTLLFFKPLVTVLGLHNIFFAFSGVNIFGIFFTIFYVPETRGKSLQEIEIELVNKKIRN